MRVGDLTGKRFGSLVVLKCVGKTKDYDKIWRCQCSCGNITDVRQGHLRSGHTTTCGCGKPQFDDYSGRKFGHLYVLRRVDDYVCPGNGKHYVRYECRCDCGNIVVVNALNLKNGTTMSCGCRRPHGQFVDLAGERFGKLTVIERVDDYVNPSGRKLVRYRCRCDCGNEIFALANALRNGDVSSCGCMGRSKAECYVCNYLDEHDVEYVPQQSFDDCLSDKGFVLSYDFYLPDFNLLIECQGKQHYESIEFFGGDERLEYQQRHDVLKAEYARLHGYSLLAFDCRGITQACVNELLDKALIADNR